MVELESENETTKLSSKINVLNQNVQTLCFLLMSWWKSLTIQNRPQGSWESKRQQYFKMLNEKKTCSTQKAIIESIIPVGELLSWTGSLELLQRLLQYSAVQYQASFFPRVNSFT